MNCTKCGRKLQFRVGSRVEAIGLVDGVYLSGKKGVVKWVDDNDILPIFVAFDKPFPGGHEGLPGRKLCKTGHGFWGNYPDFKLVKRKKKKGV